MTKKFRIIVARATRQDRTRTSHFASHLASSQQSGAQKSWNQSVICLYRSRADVPMSAIHSYANACTNKYLKVYTFKL